jgi:hypothetical protein
VLYQHIKIAERCQVTIVGMSGTVIYPCRAVKQWDFFKGGVSDDKGYKTKRFRQSSREFGFEFSDNVCVLLYGRSRFMDTFSLGILVVVLLLKKYVKEERKWYENYFEQCKKRLYRRYALHQMLWEKNEVSAINSQDMRQLFCNK